MMNVEDQKEYRYEVKNPELLNNKKYWFANTKDTDDSGRTILADDIEFDINKMNVNENSDDDTVSFLHYPNIPAGYPSIRLETENITSFSLVPHKATGMIHPLTFMEGADYKIVIPAFEYTTNSAVHVSKLKLKVTDNNGNDVIPLTTVQVGQDNVFRMSDRDTTGEEVFYITKSIVPVLEWDSDMTALCTIPYLAAFLVDKRKLNQWFTLTVEYFDDHFIRTGRRGELIDVPLGTYTLKFNLYLMEILKEFTELSLEPLVPDGYSSEFVLLYLIDSDEEFVNVNYSLGDKFDFKEVRDTSFPRQVHYKAYSEGKLSCAYEYLYKEINIPAIPEVNINIKQVVGPTGSKGCLVWKTSILDNDVQSVVHPTFILWSSISDTVYTLNDRSLTIEKRKDSASGNRIYIYYINDDSDFNFPVNPTKFQDYQQGSDKALFLLSIACQDAYIANRNEIKTLMGEIKDGNVDFNPLVMMTTSDDVIPIRIPNKSDYAIVSQYNLIGRDFSKSEDFSYYGFHKKENVRHFIPCNIITGTNYLAPIINAHADLLEDWSTSLEDKPFFGYVFNDVANLDYRINPGLYFLNTNFSGHNVKLVFKFQDLLTGDIINVESSNANPDSFDERDELGCVIYAPNYFSLKSITSYREGLEGGIADFTSCGMYKINEFIDSEPTAEVVNWKNNIIRSTDKLSTVPNTDFKYVTPNLCFGIAEHNAKCIDLNYWCFNNGTYGYQVAHLFIIANEDSDTGVGVPYGVDENPNSINFGYRVIRIDLPDGTSMNNIKFRKLVE